MILLFGANGQLGRELAMAAAAANIPLTALGRNQLDITDAAGVRDTVARTRPSLLINAAAYTKVDNAEIEPDLAWQANAVGPQVLAEVASTADIPLIHFSTDYVFDGTKASPYREDDPIAPLGAYGTSKAAGEAAIRERTPRHLILRTAWLFGRHGANFAKTITRLAGERDALRVVVDQQGSPTAAADIAAATMSIADRVRRPDAPYGTYHLAGSGATNWFGLAERIVNAQAARTGRRPRMVPIGTKDYPTAARRPPNSVLDSTRFTETFGITLPDWRDAVDRIVPDILTAGAFA